MKQPSQPSAPPIVSRLLRDALRRLDQHGLPRRVVYDDPAAGGAVRGADIQVAPEKLPSVRSLLAQLDFLGTASRGRGPGSEFLAYDSLEGEWVEVRVVTEPSPSGSGRRSRALAPRRRLGVGTLGGFPRRGIGVALLGPDGAGKSTVAEAVAKDFSQPVRSIYMGLYQQGPRRSRRRVPGIGLLASLARQWARWLASLYHRSRGRLVLFDRYTYDALLPPARGLTRLGRMRRSLLARACPAPQLVVILDAPAEVLFARAREHDPALLEQHRQGLAALAGRLPNSVVVDAAKAPEEVARQVTAAIWRSYVRRSR